MMKKFGGFGAVMDDTKSNQVKEVELHPDAWERFDRAAGTVAKAPPQHRVTKKKKARPKKRAPKKT